MNSTQAVSLIERVADWPRVSATVQAAPSGAATGALTINGTERACAAESVEALRAGMIARCASIAASLGRPVRLDVTEGTAVYRLAVRPTGVVQLVDDNGGIPSAEGLTVDEGRCRVCRRLQPVTSTSCAQCAAPEPLRVEVEPIDIGADAPEAADVDQVDDHTRIVVRRTRPELRITFDSGQEPVSLTANAALGRRPEPVDGRVPVTIDSPERKVSRTHLLVDVDDEGRILVTDHQSANGVEAQSYPPIVFDPGTPYVIQPGTSLLVGDVILTVGVSHPFS